MAGEGQCPSSRKESESSLFLCLIVLFGASTDWMMLLTLVRLIFFTQSTDSNANLFWKYPRSHKQKLYFTTIWASVSLANLLSKINHHRYHSAFPILVSVINLLCIFSFIAFLTKDLKKYILILLLLLVLQKN